MSNNILLVVTEKMTFEQQMRFMRTLLIIYVTLFMSVMSYVLYNNISLQFYGC